MESDLNKRGTRYFGGDEPRMVDFMIWPWCERMTALKHVVDREFVDQYEIKAERFPKLVKTTQINVIRYLWFLWVFLFTACLARQNVGITSRPTALPIGTGSQ